MFCPYCCGPDGEGQKTKVLDTRSFWEPNRRCFYLERRRECTKCKTRFTTKERSPSVRPTNGLAPESKLVAK